MQPLLLLMAGWFGSVAQAGGFEPKTMRDPLSKRAIERGLVLGKGWVELEFANDSKVATGYWDSEGQPQDFEHARWTYTTQRLDIRYGVTRRAELYWRIKTHYVQLENDYLGTDTSQFGIGDPEIGYTYELFKTLAPVTSVVVYGVYKAPLANESPGNYVGGANSFQAFVLTTGTPDWTFGMKAKKQFGPIAIEGGLAHIFRQSGLALYVVETDLNQFMMRIKPGNIERAHLGVQSQFGPLNLSGTAILDKRALLKIGPTSDGIIPTQALESVKDSDGIYLDARLAAELNLSNTIDFVGQANIPLVGEDLQFFPIEDIHPTRGNTYTGAFVFRY
ncbi:MAG: hypothetical protein VXZ96_13875 [Myxococcota bacterium]|nr:hypothetical protein [Myxococcota bacterium]